MADFDTMVQGINAHWQDKQPVGHFLTACLENDLESAVSYADGTSLDHIRELIQHMVKNLPAESWGSPEKVSAWLGLKDRAGKTK